MSGKVFIKSILRKPLKLIVWALLIAVIGFAFTAKITEYLVVHGETERIGSYYRAIGVVSATDLAAEWAEWDGKSELRSYNAVADYIDSLDTVAFGQRTPTTPAELVGMQNTDLDGNSFSWREGLPSPEAGVHANNMYLYGTLAFASRNVALDGPDICYIGFDVDKVEAGYEEYVHAGDRVFAYYYETEDTPTEEQFEAGGRYFIRAYYDPAEVGPFNEMKDHLMLGKLDCERWMIPVDANEELDFSSPDLAYIAGNIEAARFNMSAVCLEGTKDMSALPSFQQSVRSRYLVDGRILNREDDLTGNQVCVVHQNFAEVRGLEIGDTITLNMRDFVVDDMGYIPEGVTGWQSSTCETKTFEIVGLFTVNQTTQVTAYTNDVYVPESCLPSGFSAWEEPIYGYNFVLNSVRDKDAFIAQHRATIQDMGFELSFVQDNSDNFLKSADPMIQSAAVGALTFGLVALVGLVLTVFVYTRMQRENFAIMRALGVRKRSAIAGFILPAFVIGALMLGVSSVVAHNYAQTTAAEILSVFDEMEAEGVTMTTNLLPTVAAELGVFAVMLTLSGLMLSRRPVLELLQGVRGRRRTLSDRIDRFIFRRKDISGEEVAGEVGKFEGRELEDAPRGGVSMSIPMMRYIFRQIRRTPLKTALVVVIAAGFMFALGWMRFTVDRSIAESNRIYDTTVVEGEIVKRNAFSGTSQSSVIAEKTVAALEQSDFVENLYLESTQQRYMMAYDDPAAETYAEDNPNAIEFDSSRMEIFPTFIATNNFDAFRQRHDLNIYIAHFQNSFEENGAEMGSYCPVILHENTIKQLGLSVGDMVYVGHNNNGRIVPGTMTIAGTYTGSIRIVEGGFAAIVPLDWMKSEAATLHVPVKYSIAEFTIDTAKNREIDSFRAEMNEIVESEDAGDIYLSLLLWDEELTQVVKPLEQNVRLMSVLYPVIAVLSVIIAAGIAALLVMQIAHETALLRAVGLKRKRVLAMNIVQTAIPCVLGIICGFVVVLVLEGESLAATVGVGLICAAAYLAGAVAGSAVGSLAVLKRRPMQLLQINE